MALTESSSTHMPIAKTLCVQGFQDLAEMESVRIRTIPCTVADDIISIMAINVH
jgi:hypothetical protein